MAGGSGAIPLTTGARRGGRRYAEARGESRLGVAVEGPGRQERAPRLLGGGRVSAWNTKPASERGHSSYEAMDGSDFLQESVGALKRRFEPACRFLKRVTGHLGPKGPLPAGGLVLQDPYDFLPRTMVKPIAVERYQSKIFNEPRRPNRKMRKTGAPTLKACIRRVEDLTGSAEEAWRMDMSRGRGTLSSPPRLTCHELTRASSS
ncbi:hypothetical protein THAOC_11249 [Thalassiosira oceanica]|uniref:Uncharacterized protein n=1 Tax=Thalassiosira oceanica TaxID=159749 RepID=K0SQS5_THAOC|nr:hypothetical protein THAOC_11249 [Thalassiosira oceanica]|eukprot:EJK67685.1 hypothetical protein THAOC_11249 [Thalassiosira oceanica]